MIVTTAVALGSFVEQPSAGAAAPVVTDAVLTVCSDEQNDTGEGVHCTTTVTQYLLETGALDPAFDSRWEVMRCVGAAGVLSPTLLASATCTPSSGDITGSPITGVSQCNGSGNGPGGGVACSATITNHYATAPLDAIGAASVWQCVGGPEPGVLICDPTRDNNTASSEGLATISQCNGSGNGGGLVPAVPLLSPHCSVSGATGLTPTLTTEIDQCNGSANGGGSFLKCTASVTNQVSPPRRHGSCTNC